MDSSHLQKISDKIYKCEHGYFMKDNIWTFMPIEKKFNADMLFDITNTLRVLNEHEVS